MSSFGATTDLFTLADTYNHVQTSESSKSGSKAQCMDSNGNIVAQTNYDTGNSYSEEIQVCKGGSHTLKPIGTVIASKVITGIKIDRSNTAPLKITYTGENCSSADSDVAKFTPDVDSAYLAGGKGGIAAGIVVTKGKVISSSITITSQVAKVLDSQGVQKCKAVYGAEMEATNELQSCDTAPAATADTANTWALSPSGGGPKESNTAYPTTTFNAHKACTQDT